MPVPTKSVKAGGGTDINDGQTGVASDVNTDMNTLYDLLDGGLDEDNIDPSASIPNSALDEIAITKVGDNASTASVFLDTGSSPGDSGTPSLPTNAKGELEALRYRIAGNNAYTSGLRYTDSAGADTATDGWLEPSRIGRNLLTNPGFEAQSGAANSAPDGWTLAGTPSTVDIEAAATAAAGADKRSLNIVADAASEGIQTTVTGLKASTKYLVGMAYDLTTGSINLKTVNGLSSGDYQDVDFTDSSAPTSYAYAQGIVKTDATPTDITVQILSSANLDDFNVHYVWMYELSDSAPVEIPHIPVISKEDTTPADWPSGTLSSGWNTAEVMTDLSITQYVPYEGYRMTFEVHIPWGSSTLGSSNKVGWFDVQLDTGGGAATVEGPVVVAQYNDTSDRPSDSVYLKHVIDYPTPGLSYAFTVRVAVYGGAGFEKLRVPSSVFSAGDLIESHSRSRLIMERI